MRLIRASDCVLVDAREEGWPKYAILSHVWRKREVTYLDMLGPRADRELQNELFSKVIRCCEVTLQAKLEYVWIDTCCINKQDSAELSEAINSMYKWYEQAAVCFAYLFDIDHDLAVYGNEWTSSEWFDRGWTLQELIAPKYILFFDMYWQELGTKRSLGTTLSEKTGIDVGILAKNSRLSSQSIAQRMSWAANRKTTRKEDEAYCLLGLFGVNMPMIYGEGENAFIRLQEEIIRRSDDHSIFAWHILNEKEEQMPAYQQGLHGLLASAPACFRNCRSTVRTASRHGSSAYTMSNRGLSITLDRAVWTTDTYIVRLQCDDANVQVQNSEQGRLTTQTRVRGRYSLAILLVRLYSDDQYARIAAKDGRSIIRLDDYVWHNGSIMRSASKVNVNVPQNVYENFTSFTANVETRTVAALQLKVPALFENQATWQWSPDSQKCMVALWADEGILLTLNHKTSESGHGFVIDKLKIGIDYDGNPICFLATKQGLSVSSIDSRRQYTPAESMALGGIHDRKINSRAEWPEIWSRIKGTKAWPVGEQPDLWALRGDRVEDIDLHLCRANDLAGETILCRIVVQKVTVEYGEFAGCLVWELSLTELLEHKNWFSKKMSLQ